MEKSRQYVLKLVPILILALVMTAVLPACSFISNRQPGPARPLVITTLFPQYDFIRQIAGDKVEFRLLIPPGVEPHAYEPTPRDLADIRRADLFVYTGDAMEPWVKQLLEADPDGGMQVVDASRGIELWDGEESGEQETEDHGIEEPDAHEHDSHTLDPHIWLDPVLAQTIVDNITDGLAAADPANSLYYRAQALEYKKKLQELHQRFEYALQNTQTRTLLFGGHFVFGYFARRYGLDYETPYFGFSPNAEPAPQAIAQLIQTMESHGLDTIFYEELVQPRVAQVIAQQTGANMLLLHGAHNLSKAELDAGVTYLDIMEQNLINLKLGLGSRD
ncbi:MAG TPA: ABC transporter substrate-binding protein [Clostridiales bacterium]|nr:ABC transporter substrate-binding protein [Clostridiales bacterium]